MKAEVKAEASRPQEASQKTSVTLLSDAKQPDASAAMIGGQQQEVPPSQLDASLPQSTLQSAKQGAVENPPFEEIKRAADGQQQELGEAAKHAAAHGNQIPSGSIKTEAGPQPNGVKAEHTVASGKLEEPAQQKTCTGTSFMDLLTGRGEPGKQPAKNPGANPATLFKPVTGALAQGSHAPQAVPSSSQPASQPTNAITMAYQKIAAGPLSAKFGPVSVLLRASALPCQYLQINHKAYLCGTCKQNALLAGLNLSSLWHDKCLESPSHPF